MACDAVTRRASEGPCVECGFDNDHPGYIGVILQRCGHEESEGVHRDGPLGRPMGHAYEEESE